MRWSGALLLGFGVVLAIRDPSRLDRHWTPVGYVGAFALVVTLHLVSVAWTGRKLRNAVVKRRWIRWLRVSVMLYAAVTAAVLLGPATALALGFATQVAYWRAMYELAGASSDDWDRRDLAQRA